MKTYKIFISLAFMLLFISACDLEELPYDQVEDETLLAAESAIQTATYGNYAFLKGSGVDDYYSWYNNWHRLCEYPGDNVSLSGTTTDPLFYTYNYTGSETSYRIRETWQASYRVILSCNKIIESATEGESTELDYLLGENYYLRGMIYFQLVNLFGRPYYQGTSNLGVPVKTDTDIDNLPPRSTVGQVYTQVIADLEKAASLMSEELYKGSIYASVYSAEAMLARVYLYMGNNADAIDYATSVIDDGPYSLLPTANLPLYPTYAPENNDETIFALKSLKDKDYRHGWYSVGAMYANIMGTGWGEMYASKPYMDLIDQHPEDVRREFIDPQYVTNDAGEQEYWAMYVDDAYKYVLKELTWNDASSEYTYEEEGATLTVTEEAGPGSETLYYIFEEGEQTYVEIIPRMATRNGYPKWYITKCSGQEDQAQLWSPVISRLAELYLIRAEANAKLGNDQLALDDVNVIRERAGLSGAALWTAGNIPSGKDVFDIVMEERQLELAWEGHRKFDVFRNGLTMDRRYPGTHTLGNEPILTIPPDHLRVVEFIPEVEILAQPNLEQNPR